MSDHRELFRRKAAIEAEIDALVEMLTDGPGAPGLSGNLLTEDGFPRSDIDVYHVRQQRQRVAVLRTDHAEVMRQIEALLFSGKAFGPPAAASAAGTASASAAADPPPPPPPASSDNGAPAAGPGAPVQ